MQRPGLVHGLLARGGQVGGPEERGKRHRPAGGGRGGGGGGAPGAKGRGPRHSRLRGVVVVVRVVGGGGGGEGPDGGSAEVQLGLQGKAGRREPRRVQHHQGGGSSRRGRRGATGTTTMATAATAQRRASSSRSSGGGPLADQGRLTRSSALLLLLSCVMAAAVWLRGGQCGEQGCRGAQGGQARRRQLQHRVRLQQTTTKHRPPQQQQPVSQSASAGAIGLPALEMRARRGGMPHGGGCLTDRPTLASCLGLRKTSSVSTLLYTHTSQPAARVSRGLLMRDGGITDSPQEIEHAQHLVRLLARGATRQGR